jgi:hypothetical protein
MDWSSFCELRLQLIYETGLSREERHEKALFICQQSLGRHPADTRVGMADAVSLDSLCVPARLWLAEDLLDAAAQQWLSNAAREKTAKKSAPPPARAIAEDFDDWHFQVGFWGDTKAADEYTVIDAAKQAIVHIDVVLLDPEVKATADRKAWAKALKALALTLQLGQSGAVQGLALLRELGEEARFAAPGEQLVLHTARVKCMNEAGGALADRHDTIASSARAALAVLAAEQSRDALKAWWRTGLQPLLRIELASALWASHFELAIEACEGEPRCQDIRLRAVRHRIEEVLEDGKLDIEEVWGLVDMLPVDSGTGRLRGAVAMRYGAHPEHLARAMVDGALSVSLREAPPEVVDAVGRFLRSHPPGLWRLALGAIPSAILQDLTQVPELTSLVVQNPPERLIKNLLSKDASVVAPTAELVLDGSSRLEAVFPTLLEALSSPSCPLRRLSLRDCDLTTEEDIRGLCDALTRSWTLAGTLAGPRGTRELTRLDLSHNQLGPDAVGPLCDLISACPGTLTVLAIEGHSFLKAGELALVKAAMLHWRLEELQGAAHIQGTAFAKPFASAKAARRAMAVLMASSAKVEKGSLQEDAMIALSHRVRAAARRRFLTGK